LRRLLQASRSESYSMTIDPVELVAAVITAVSIWLATRENVWYYPTGIVSVFLYGWIFFDARLYAEMLLQVVWFSLMVYGWYQWLHGGVGKSELHVSRTPRWGWITVLTSGVVMMLVTIAIQTRYTDNPAPLVDSTIAAWSIVAQWMTARKWLENWLFWLGINTLAVPLYLSRELWFTAILYGALWVLAVVGYRTWRRSLASA
jgi:nicotinamide mononucleotide transporter